MTLFLGPQKFFFKGFLLRKKSCEEQGSSCSGLFFLFKLLLFFHVVYLLSFLQSNHKDNQMHNCEDGDENESVSLDAALSAASKNQGNLLKGNDNKTVRSKPNYILI